MPQTPPYQPNYAALSINPEYFKEDFSVDAFLVTLTKDVISPTVKQDVRNLSDEAAAKETIERVQLLQKRFARAEDEIALLTDEVTEQLLHLQHGTSQDEQNYKARCQLISTAVLGVPKHSCCTCMHACMHLSRCQLPTGVLQTAACMLPVKATQFVCQHAASVQHIECGDAMLTCSRCNKCLCAQAEVRALERTSEGIKDGIRAVDSKVSRINQTATRIGDRLQVRRWREGLWDIGEGVGGGGRQVVGGGRGWRHAPTCSWCSCALVREARRCTPAKQQCT
jgi:hypothetical protein